MAEERHAAAHSRRLFFALWPDSAARRAMTALTKTALAASQGRAVAVEKLHVTLAFLGNVGPEKLESLSTLSATRIEPFELTLDRLTYRRGARMLWLEPSVLPTELMLLEDRLWRQLSERGFERESRPFRPHVTLARGAINAKTPPIKPLDWIVGEFSLCESRIGDAGSVYATLQTWPLGTSA
jgi:2'-5' RNA ligase